MNESDDDLKQKQMDRMWNTQYPKQRPDLNGKRTKKRFDWNDKTSDSIYFANGKTYYIDPTDPIEGEKASKEFLNRPNAATDYKHFPRFSKHRDYDFNDLKNGTQKIQDLKRELKQRKEEEYEELIYVTRKKVKQELNKIGFKLKNTNYSPSSLTKKDIKLIKSILQENDKYNGDLFPDFKIDINEKNVWFRFLKNYLNEYTDYYNPYKCSVLAYQLGITDTEPKYDEKLDVYFSKPGDIDVYDAMWNNY